MAILSRFVCPDCGYEIETNENGNDSLMSGTFYEFFCPDCKEIVSLRYDEIGAQKYGPTCPECGGRNLRNWNPIDCGCPKCGQKLEQQLGFIMAD